MTTPKRDHPAAFPRYILDRLALWIGKERREVGSPLKILDCFAGVGRIHDLPKRLGTTVGVELEPEWAACRRGTIVGDATALPDDWTGRFDVVATSCVYGNRLSDHHEARDSCFACQGIGTAWTEEGCGDAPFVCPDCHNIACTCGGIGQAMKTHVANCARCRRGRCNQCGGTGLSRRHTYRHTLGRPLSDNNAGQMHFPNEDYLTLHKQAWAEAHRVLRPGGLILVNVKNFIAGGVEQFVSEWHEQTLVEVGFVVERVDLVPSPGLRDGANGSVRVANEQIVLARRPS